MTRSRVRASLRRGREELQLGAGGRAASPVAAVPALLAGLVLLRRPLRGAPRRRPLLPLRHQENLRQGQVGEHKDVYCGFAKYIAINKDRGVTLVHLVLLKPQTIEHNLAYKSIKKL